MKHVELSAASQLLPRSVCARRFGALVLAFTALSWPTAAHAEGAPVPDKNGVKPQVINLPSGPGSIQGLGDAFQPQLNTGTATYAVAISLPPGVGGHTPSLKLAYNAGFGNGPFGAGWRMDVPYVQRQTDKGLPQYGVGDRFISGSGEELVESSARTFRARIEGGYAQFKRIGDRWEIWQKDGKRWVLGESKGARLYDTAAVPPDDAGSVTAFMWLAERFTDTNGNEIHFSYRRHMNQVYLSEIRYNFPRGAPIEQQPDDRGIRVVVQYDEGRLDPLTDFRSRYRVQTALRATAIEVWVLGERLRRYELRFATGVSGASLLASVRMLGRGMNPPKWEDSPEQGLPPVRFTYAGFDPSLIERQSTEGVPSRSVGSGDTELADVNADSLPDIVYFDRDKLRYFLNRGLPDGQSPRRAARFDNGVDLPSPGILLSDANSQLVDIDGDSRADFLYKASVSPDEPFQYLPNRGNGWELAPRRFSAAAAFSFQEPGVELIDLNHDKRTDVLRTTTDAYYTFLNQGETWAGSSLHTGLPNLGGGPLVLGTPGVSLADLNGDRLTDLVYVNADSGAVTYFPHKGYAVFDAPVRMGNGLQPQEAVSFPHRWADVNGDGLADLILIGRTSISIRINRAGVALNDAVYTSGGVAPTYDDLNTTLRVADMNGDGDTDLVYVRQFGAVEELLQFIDFSGGTKSDTLSTIDNALGRVIGLAYRTSTDYYVDAWDAGAPWDLRSPIPVTVVSRSTVHDKLSGQTYSTDYTYRNAYYDSEEKAFRGFALAQQIDRGGASAPTQVQRIIFDTGATDESRKGQILQADSLAEGGSCGEDSLQAAASAATAMIGDVSVPKIGGQAGDDAQAVQGCYQRTINRLESRRLAAGISGDNRPISHTVVVQVDTLVFENTPDYRRKQQRFEYDDFGNATQQFDYGEVAADGSSPGLGNDERLTYMTYIADIARWMVDRVSETRVTDLAGGFVSHARAYYDGAPYQGLPSGQLTLGNVTRQEADTGPNDPNRRWIQSQRFRYDAYGNQVGRMDPNGTVGADGAPGPGGHWTEAAYDTTFHQYPERETIHLEGGRSLALIADYDFVLGVITGAVEFNGHALAFGYDGLGRLTKLIKPGDTLDLPTQALTYTLGSTVSSITSDSREVSGAPGAYRSMAYVDGLGRTVQTRSEGEDGKVVVNGAVVFNARGKEAEKYLPYFAPAGDWAYAPPDAAAPKAILAYDPLGRDVRTTNPDGTFSQVAFRPFEKDMADEEDTNSQSPHFDTPLTQRMDGLGRVLGTIERNGAEAYTTTFRYDLMDNLVKITDTRGNLKTQSFDGLKRKLGMVDPDRGPMTYRYDDVGNMLEVLDAKNQRTLFTYDGANRQLTENWVMAPGDTTPEIRYHYDTDKAPEYADAMNTLGRLAWVEDLSGSEYVSYDARGNPVGRIKRIAGADKDFVTLLDYDAMDRPIALTYPDGTRIAYRYNAQNQLESIPGFIENIDYTASAQRLGMATADGVTTAYAYDRRLRLTDLGATNGGGSVLQAYHYTFDGTSNILGIDDRRPDRTAVDDDTRTFTTDGLYRLTSVTYAAGGDRIDYGYDPIGNMIRKESSVPSEHLGDMRHGQGAGPHALTEVKGERWVYDANGNLTAKPGIAAADPDLTLTWDFRDRLVGIAGTNTLRQDHVFDHANRRVRKQVTTAAGTYEVWYPDKLVEKRGDQLVKYIFAGDQRVAEVRTPYSPYRMLRGFAGVPEPRYGFDAGGDGKVSASDVAARGGDRRVVEYTEVNDALSLILEQGQDTNPTISLETVSGTIANYRAHAAPRSEPAPVFYHSDHLGSSTLLVDGEGSVAERVNYYPYGTERHRSDGAGVAHRFTGKELDGETGLYDYGARFYDAGVGRFLSVDPLAVSEPERILREVLSSHPFAYSYNRPLTHVDPDGRDARIVVTGNTIVVKLDIVIHGPDATPKQAKLIEAAIEKVWNNNGKGWKYKDKENTGRTFRVKFDATVKLGSATLNDNANYVEIDKNQTISYVNTADGKTGRWEKITVKKDRTYAHEVGHLLGLDDRYTNDSAGYAHSNKGWKNNLMAAEMGKIERKNLKAVLGDTLSDMQKAENQSQSSLPRFEADVKSAGVSK